MPLTDAVIRNAKRVEKRARLLDEKGLALVLEPKKSHWWRFDYMFAGRRKTISFGTLEHVTLEQARERRREARQQVADGQDPAVLRRQARQAAKVGAATTVELVAREWLADQTQLVPSTLARNTFLLERYIFPRLGARPMAEIEPPDLLEALQPLVRARKLETAHRTKQLFGQIARYAIASRRAIRDPSRDLRGILRPVVRTPYAAAIDPADVGRLLDAIDHVQGAPAISVALRMLPLVFVRPGELRHAEWREFDLPHALWRIPARRMKMRDDHLVPLSRQVLALLDEIKAHTGGGLYVFPSLRTRTKPISDMSLLDALRRLGFTTDEATPHGFRATARTLLDERLRYPPDVIEVQLAHVVRGPLGATYNRSRYLEQRIDMMQAWATYLDTLKSEHRRRIASGAA